MTNITSRLYVMVGVVVYVLGVFVYKKSGNVCFFVVHLYLSGFSKLVIFKNMELNPV